MRVCKQAVVVFALFLLCSCSVSPAKPLTHELKPDNLPVIGGTPGMRMLAEAVVSESLGEAAEDVSRDIGYRELHHGGYDALAEGDIDILLMTEPDEEAKIYARQRGVELKSTPIVRDALTFVIGEAGTTDNVVGWSVKTSFSGDTYPLRYDSDQELKAYTGEVGSPEYAALHRYFNLNESITKEWSVAETFDGKECSFGVTTYYNLLNGGWREGLRIMSVESIFPDVETIESFKYKYPIYICAVIRADTEEDSPAGILYNLLTSKEGADIAAKKGYVVSARQQPVFTLRKLPEIEKYMPSEEIAVRVNPPGTTLPALRENLGRLYPYVGRINEYYIYGSVERDYFFGLADAEGGIVTDAVYENINYLSPEESGLDEYVYELIELDMNANGEPIRRTRYIAADMSWMSGPFEHLRHRVASGRYIGIEGSSFAAIEGTGPCYIYDIRSGELIKSFDGFLYEAGDGMMAYEQNGAYIYVDYDGSYLFTSDTLAGEHDGIAGYDAPSQWPQGWHSTITHNSEDYKRRIEFVRGDEIVSLDDYYYAEEAGDKVLIQVEGGICVFDLVTGKILSRLPYMGTYGSAGDVIVLWQSVGGEFKYGIAGMDGSMILPIKYGYLNASGPDRFAVADGIYGGLMDDEGNWLLKINAADID